MAPDRRVPLSLAVALALVALAAPGRTPAVAADAAAGRPNVLFIAVDDLNHWVRHLGRSDQALTPNLDRLAKRGVTFTSAHCAAPLCNPSRAALMSGLRPSTTGVYQNGTDWRPAIAEELTLPTFFRRNGYRVVGAGKIYHGGFDRRSEWDDYYRKGTDRPLAEPPVRGKGAGANGISWNELESGDASMEDHRVVDWCIRELERKDDRPFFIACGIVKPHLPWDVPKKYFDLHDLAAIRLPPVREKDLDDVPPAGVRMASPGGDHARIVEAGLWKEAVRAYLACISYADAEVGRLVEALDRSPHRDRTIVVLWGDHGWHLGEKEHWRKFTLWEESTRAPLIWVVPDITRPGGVCRRTVDFLSIYPTLADLCGLAPPAHLEGASLRRLLADPGAEWTRPALTTFGFRNHAVRTERWRYIRYADGGEELYDEAADPFEWTNLAGKPELGAVKEELGAWLPKTDAPEARSEGRKPRARAKAKVRAKAAAEAAPEPASGR